jgi:hypothetical protein
MRRLRVTLLVAAVFALRAQQIADPGFHPPLPKPAFPAGAGPVVLLDEGHFNFHTSTGRYQPFAALLGRDGYAVRAPQEKFTPQGLGGVQVLVIANALHETNRRDWRPPHPSAFTAEEIAAVRDWVVAGGALLLIADHMPFAGAARELGAGFGVAFSNGYAIVPRARGPMLFRRSDGALKDHPITAGIDAVATFTGSAFQIAHGAPLLVFGPDAVLAETLQDPTPSSVAGYLQGAALIVGRGRVAVFGEAAMFTAQLVGPAKQRMGMNHPAAGQNAQFLRNVMGWLSAAKSR